MLLSAVSVLVVAQSSSEIPEGLTNNPVCMFACQVIWESQRVASEPPTAPECYDFHTIHCTRDTKKTSDMC